MEHTTPALLAEIRRLKEGFAAIPRLTRGCDFESVWQIYDHLLLMIGKEALDKAIAEVGDE